MKKVLALSAMALTLSVFSCGDVADSIVGGGGVIAANAVIVTLTYWETKETDLLDSKLDPEIYFNVVAYESGRQVSKNSTTSLLRADNVGQTWSGYSKSSPISFVGTADELRIYAVVIERDPLANDDISPGYYAGFDSPFVSGVRGSKTLNYGSGKSKVSLDYEFVSH